LKGRLPKKFGVDQIVMQQFKIVPKSIYEGQLSTVAKEIIQQRIQNIPISIYGDS
jgi:hypothetical protein